MNNKETDRSRSRENSQHIRTQKYSQVNNFQRGPSNQRPLPSQYQVPQQIDGTRRHPSPSPQPKRTSSSPIRIQAQRVPQQVFHNKQQNNREIRQKSPLNDVRKIQTIQNLSQYLQNCKKPIIPTDSTHLHLVFQKFSNKYPFQHLIQQFLYFFVHSNVDQNHYKTFYMLILKVKSTQNQFQNNQGTVLVFYDILIRRILNTINQQFKAIITTKINGLDQTNYWTIDPILRDQMMNKSFYSNGGSNIKSLLTLIRKAMQKQKVVQNVGIHPIRRILKLLKQLTLRSLSHIFFPLTQLSPIQTSTSLLLLSQTHLILHFKYKHHQKVQFQQTLDQLTSLKMKILELSRAKQDKAMLFRQYTVNYLYLMFMLNLGHINRESKEHIFVKEDYQLFQFYIHIILDQYHKSHSFLKTKLSDHNLDLDKSKFYQNMITNFGIILNQQQYQTTIKQNLKSHNLYTFIMLTYANIMQKSISYSLQICQLTKNPLNKPQRLISSILICLNPFISTFNKVKKFKEFQERIDQSQFQIQIEQSSQQSQQSLKKYELKYLFIKNYSVLLKELSKLKTKIIKKLNSSQQPIIQTLQSPSKNQQKVLSAENSLYKTNYINKFVQIINYLIANPINKTEDQQIIKFKVCFYLVFQIKQYLIVDLELNYNKTYNKAQIVGENQDNINKIIYINQCKVIQARFNDYQLIKIQFLNKFIKTKLQSNSQIILDLNRNICSMQYSVIDKKKSSKINNSNDLFKKFFIQQLLKNCQNKQQIIINQNLYQQKMNQKQDSLIISNAQKLNNKLHQFIDLANQIDKVNNLNSQLKIKILHKKIQLQSQKIINQDLQIFLGLFNIEQSNKKHFANYSIKIQLALQDILIQMFKIVQNLQQNIKIKYLNDNFIKQIDGYPKNNPFKSSLSQKLGISLNRSKPTLLIQKYPLIINLLSKMLQKIYYKCIVIQKQKQSTLSSLKQSFNLEQILISKIKKCISLFYDKLTQDSIKQLLIKQNTFILKCIVITNYKIKVLCDILLDTSHNITQLQQSLFFYIPDKSLIQLYIKAISLKDKTYFRSQVIKLKRLSSQINPELTNFYQKILLEI